MMKVDNDQLDKLLADLQASTTPQLPENFQNSVWRQIRNRRTTATGQASNDILNRFFNFALCPQPIAIALVLSLVLGGFTGFLSLSKPTHALQLDAFSAHAPGMLSAQIK